MKPRESPLDAVQFVTCCGTSGAADVTGEHADFGTHGPDVPRDFKSPLGREPSNQRRFPVNQSSVQLCPGDAEAYAQLSLHETDVRDSVLLAAPPAEDDDVTQKGFHVPPVGTINFATHAAPDSNEAVAATRPGMQELAVEAVWGLPPARGGNNGRPFAPLGKSGTVKTATGATADFGTVPAPASHDGFMTGIHVDLATGAGPIGRLWW
jgi:hypothetical protein